VRVTLYEATKERSPVITCHRAVETIYARRDDLPPIVLDLAAGMALMMVHHGFHDFDRAPDRRGVRIAGALRRLAGTLPEGVEAQSEDLDPAPDPAFVPPAAEPA
jgi:hypothetical protein